MYVTENSMGLCVVLEHNGDIAQCLSAFFDFNNRKPYNGMTYIPSDVIEALEEEIAQ